MEQLGYTWIGFCETVYIGVLLKYVWINGSVAEIRQKQDSIHNMKTILF
jgi:hypothetical protein